MPPIVQTLEPDPPSEDVATPSDAADVGAALRAHHEAAWSWARSLCRGDRDAAHDLLHDAYLKVLNGNARFDGRSTFKTWLFGVIRVSALGVRRRRLIASLFFEPLGPRAERVALAPRETPVVAASPRLLAVWAALPARQKQIASLVFEHDLTVEDAAQVMRVSLGAARQHYTRAKGKLRAAANLEIDDHE